MKLSRDEVRLPTQGWTLPCKVKKTNSTIEMHNSFREIDSFVCPCPVGSVVPGSVWIRIPYVHRPSWAVTDFKNKKIKNKILPRTSLNTSGPGCLGAGVPVDQT